MMKRMFLNILMFCLLICLSKKVWSQKDTGALTLENLYKNHHFQQRGFGPVRWMKDNKGYSTIERNPQSGWQEIIRYEARTGSRSVVVASTQLIPNGHTAPLPIEGYEWSTADDKLLVFTNSKKVWRYNTRGDYWILNIKTAQLQQLGKGLDPSSLMFAKFSPEGTRVAYVSNQNVYVEDIATGAIKQLTSDGEQNIINGTFDWVYEEELDGRDGFRWSPDGNFIAYWQSDTKAIGTFYLINNIDSIYSRPIPLPYPKVGTTLSKVKVGVIPAIGGTTKWFDIPGDPADNYLPRMDFIPHSSEVLIQQLNRLQNTNHLWIGNVANMTLKKILTEKDSAFLDLHDNIKWLNNQKYFTWTSERDGWLHLYKVSRDGKEIMPITKGNFDVININCIDEKGGFVYYIASPDNFTERYLYRSRIDGKGEAERVTPAGMAGQHSYQMSSDAQWAIHTFQNTTTPPRISLVALKNHQQVKLLEDNQALKDRYDHLGVSPRSFFKVDIEEDRLDAFMIKPADFDPAKKYPLLFYVYGEPAGSTVQNNWDGGEGLWHQYLAQKGYIIVSVDNRGTKTPRGHAWRASIYGQIGILASADQSKAAKKIFKMFPFIDTSRVGIWGWSGGGQMTLNCMFRYPEIYKTGLAVSFVSDQKLYDATYQERYMGLLTENQKGYHDGSPINYAGNLKGKLMIIHGTGDDNVHYQSFEKLVNELIRKNKLFRMMSYPMRTHSISEGENTTLHLRETMEKFWNENL
jgi:dipeptidyl-peptidase-4